MLKRPKLARHVRTYAEFRGYLSQLVDGTYQFLWVLGRPGLGKTESINAATKGKSVYYRNGGQLTPLQFYKDLYAHRGQPVILDDAEHILDDPNGLKLVNSLGEIKSEKLIPYGSTTKALGDVPQTFLTSSSLCVLANVETKHVNLKSRAVELFFDPPQEEIHQAVAGWFWDQDIHNWVGQHLTRLAPLDVRWYLKAHSDKRAGRDWAKLLLETHGLSPVCSTVQDLEANPRFPTREDKAAQFVALTTMSKRTYYRIHDKLKSEGCLTPFTMESISVQGFNRQPPPTTAPELDATAETAARPRQTIVDAPDADKLAWEKDSPAP